MDRVLAAIAGALEEVDDKRRQHPGVPGSSVCRAGAQVTEAAVRPAIIPCVLGDGSATHRRPALPDGRGIRVDG